MTDEEHAILRAKLHKFITDEVQDFLPKGDIITNWILVFEGRGEEYNIGTVSGDVLGELPLPPWTFTGLLNEAIEIKNMYVEVDEEED